MARGNTAMNPVSQPVVSKTWRKYMSQYSRQIFTGPPENTREYVMTAAKSMLAGDWQKASKCILGLEVWNLFPNEGGAKAKAMLATKLREEAVRTYLLSSGVSAYTSLSLQHLCDTFDMQPEPARKIISRMIFNKEISAAWEADATLVLHKVESSSTQTLSISLAEKVASLVDTNERLLDAINGGALYAQRDEWQGHKNRWQGDQQSNRRFQKSGAVGRGGSEYHNRGGYKGRGEGRGGRGGRGYNRDRQYGDRKQGDRSGNQGGDRHEAGKKHEQPKNPWGNKDAAAAVQNAWGVK